MRSFAYAGRTYRYSAAVSAFIISTLLLTVSISAAEEDLIAQEIQNLLDRMDTHALQDMVPEISFSSVLQSASQGKSLFDPLPILKSLKSTVVDAFMVSIPSLLRIIGTGILSSGIVQMGIKQEAGKLCELVGSMCTGLMVSAQIADLFTLSEQIMQRITDFTSAILPTLLALLTACGAERSAAGLKRLTLAVTGGFSETIQGVLLTMLGCASALLLVSAVAEDAVPRSVCKTIRSIVHWVLGACFVVLLGCIAVQGSVGAHYDGVVLRVARYAVDKTIPVVGGLFKDASDTLLGCASVVKNAVGTAGLAALCAMAMQPMCRILCMTFGCRLCAAALEPFGAGRICGILHGYADIMITLFILILSAWAMSLIMLSALMYTGMGFL